MNQVVTIPNPKSLEKERELVLIPKKEYEEFNVLKKAIQIRKGEEWFWTPEWQKKELEADTAIRAGKLSGPFSDSKKLLLFLKKKR
ncbi:hypothetical protein A3G55_04000 [Candidatus Giovannonibacteria bacterium RIFCSPLOWO2_12_FULL_44_25]|uniref:Transcriptional regulator, AbrB family n=3 Tax=Candidatus Giovannoniibacteriota TaxID=1752738 RepID=A0A0G1IDW2_9BACT|nr:MAG: Transcriptional regulator, AbrB family [Parcubacteria group bacterium GW2011_GWC1_44_10]KKT57008.1 MAG: Transcriptional regulator, AbrB family [Candidatus Giovannonibacteria bacterium GW2011_GWB1_44_23]KKT59619.1 MAG: Transcriptional regulator, AbrB family [Candidatus Giovannonibacteria bacterium GW2011_GWA1_44_25]OGF49835.1 MAG: hypothetical protein A2120_01285 [Candidatus Giovannonibacteria bacterium GWA2_45_15]OGF60206.1 MAG: hypothetical protein A2656_00075 [Candidatus Giovannonibac